MRPPQITGGNNGRRHPDHRRDVASMRPPQITGGNSTSLSVVHTRFAGKHCER